MPQCHIAGDANEFVCTVELKVPTDRDEMSVLSSVLFFSFVTAKNTKYNHILYSLYKI